MKKTIGTVAAAVGGALLLASCGSTSGASGSKADGWFWDFSKLGAYDAVSPNAQDNVKVGQDEEHGKFLSFDFTGSNSNTRGAYYNFKGGAPADPVYVIEFDASLKAGNNQGSAFAIYSGDQAGADTNNGLSKGWIINMTSGPRGPWTINETKTADIPAAKWCHYKLIVDRNQKLVSTVIIDENGTELTNKAVTAYNGNGAVKGVYMLAGRYQAVLSIDNVNIRAAKDGEGIGELGEEELTSAKFVEPPKALIKPTEEAADYVFDFHAYGDRMGDLTEKAEVTWTFGGIDTSDAAVAIKQEGAKATITVKKGDKSHVGVIKATAKIGEKEVTASTPFVIINAAADPTQIAPAAGYPTDYKDYGDGLVGYQAAPGGQKDMDTVFGWTIYGSNGARTLTLVKDEDGVKSLEFDNHKGGGSTIGVYQWRDQKKKFVVEATFKYDNSVDFGIYGNSTPNDSAAIKYAGIYAGGGMAMIGSSAIMGVNAHVFYKYVMTVDPAAKNYVVEIFDMNGKQIGKSDPVELGATQGRFLCISGGFPTNLAAFKAYTVGGDE